MKSVFTAPAAVAAMAALALPALLGSAPTPPQTAPCEVSGATASASDVTLARRACEVARERFAGLFGDPAPSVNVILRDQAGYRTGVQGRRAVIYWPTSAALGGRGGAGSADGGADGGADGASGPYDADPWREILPHEIAHMLLAARFFGPGHEPSAGPGGYGTPFPDWLDEAVAIWAEPAASRRDRLREARRLPPARRDLRAILSARHPASGDPAVLAMRDGGAPPEDEDLFAFYPQAFAVLGFLYDAGGRAAVLALAERLRADPAAGPRAWVGLPGLPGDFVAVEARWQRWLAEESAGSAAAR